MTPDRRQPQGLHFDMSISLGSVIQLIVLLSAMWAGVVRLEDRITRLEVMVNAMWDTYTQGK